MKYSRGILSDFIEFNPRESLSKGSPAKEVAMADLMPFQKKISSYCVSPYRGGMKFRNGDTLLARITPCLENGKTAFVDILSEDEVGFGSTEYIVLRAIPQKMVPEFVFYFVISDWFRKRAIALMTGSSGRQRIQTDKLMNLEVTMPDLETQKKIIKILSVIDQKIELNRKQNQNLNDIIKTLFKKTLNGISDTVKLGEISKVFSGKRPDSLSEKDKYEVVGARNVMGYTNAYNQEAETIITGRVGTLGIIKRYPRKTWASDNTLVIDTEYKNCIECFLSGINFDLYNRGSTQPLITQMDLKNLIIPFEKERFLTAEQKMTPLRNKIFSNELKNEQLALLRDTLLPKLLSGSINLESI